jgi:tetratricopeptide (TPR) repeat protein
VLGLPGEEVLALTPLATQDGIELFLRRAKAAKPGFEPNAEDEAAIAPLVRLLDGLPLAIELAAVRIRVMPPRVVLARMNERFKLLTSASGRVDRQAALRAVFDWSWDLLSLPEKAALAQLSVFEGGFALEAVETVLDLSRYDDAPWPVDVLQSLAQKSLVRPIADDRFDLLVSVQEYAAEHLSTDRRYEGSGAAARLAAEARHGRYFANIDERAATAHGCAELDNLVVACRRAAARGEVEVAARALERAWCALKLRGPYRAGLELVSVVEVGAVPAPAAYARVNWVAGRALDACGHASKAVGRLEAAIAAARAVGDRECECRALIELASAKRTQGDPDSAGADLEAALNLAVAMDDPSILSELGNGLGGLEQAIGHLDKARAHYEKALDFARKAGNRHKEGIVLANLASISDNLGMSEVARSYYEGALAVAQELGDRSLEGSARCNLGLQHFLEGDLNKARDQLAAALAVAREMGHVNLECIVLCNLGIVHESLNDLNEAESDFGRALAIAREMDHKRSEGQVLGYLGLLHARRAEFSDANRCLDDSEALLRAVSDLESLGILLAIRAETERLAGDLNAARAALSAAESIAAEVLPGSRSEFGHVLARARTSLVQ